MRSPSTPPRARRSSGVSTPVTAFDAEPGKGFAETRRHVFCRCDEAAEQNGIAAIFQQWPKQFSDGFELWIRRRRQRFCLTNQSSQHWIIEDNGCGFYIQPFCLILVKSCSSSTATSLGGFAEH